MTDRYNALTVALDHDIRSDDCEFLILAIRQLKGVRDVTGNVVGIDSWTAEVRAKTECFEAIRKVLFP